jgi:hypothetical protein
MHQSISHASIDIANLEFFLLIPNFWHPWLPPILGPEDSCLVQAWMEMLRLDSAWPGSAAGSALGHESIAASSALHHGFIFFLDGRLEVSPALN